MTKRASKVDLGKPPVIPQENFQEGVLPSKAFGLKREERGLVAAGENKFVDRPVMLCVLAVEELTRAPARVAEEYQYRRHTSPSLVGDMMFPEKYDENGHKVQGPKNGQGAALVAAKWLRKADKLGYIEYYFAQLSRGNSRSWSRGWKITASGIKAAVEWAKHPWAVEWYKDREAYAQRRKEASDRIRARARSRKA